MFSLSPSPTWHQGSVENLSSLVAQNLVALVMFKVITASNVTSELSSTQLQSSEILIMIVLNDIFMEIK